MSDEDLGQLPEDEPDELEDDVDDEALASIDDVDVIQALRSAMAAPDSQPSKIQRGVQKKIRDESRGRFFADGWSTARAPSSTFLITSLLMLVIVVLAFLLLSPRGLELFK